MNSSERKRLEKIRGAVEIAKKEVMLGIIADACGGMPHNSTELSDTIRSINGNSSEMHIVRQSKQQQAVLIPGLAGKVFNHFQSIMKEALKQLHKTIDKNQTEERLTKRIFAIIPTYEKEEDIDKTIESLLIQSRPVDKIIVVINGDTQSLAAYEKALPYAIVFNQVVLEYPKGLSGKVNALNWAFENYCVSLGEDDFILGLDADVICDENMVLHLEDDIFKEPLAAGIMSRYGFMLEEDGLTKSEKSILYSQRHEFAMTGIKHQLRGYTSDILGGQATLFRAKALRQAAEKTYGNKPWDIRSKVEDAELTRVLQKLGYKTKTSANARAWVGPMYNASAWQKQRRKWQDGHLEDLCREFSPIRDKRRWFSTRLFYSGTWLLG